MLRKIRDLRKLIYLIPALWLAGTCTSLQADENSEAENSATVVVEAFNTALLQTMKAGGYQARLATIKPAVASYFQLQTIARISLGKHWQTLDFATQTAFQTLMAELIATTYAARFSQFNGQVFQTLTSEPLSRDRVRVKTRLVTASETVSLDYQLQATSSGPRIYDIVANGVSDLSLKRANYSAIFNEHGLEGVIAGIRQQIQTNATAMDN